MTKDTSEPAFPAERVRCGDGEWLPAMYSGMTLRDYFAAKAIQGLMGRDWSDFKISDDELIALWARSAYGVADAMLKAREQ